MMTERELHAEQNLLIAYFHGATFTGEYHGSKGGYSDTTLMDYTKIDDIPNMIKYVSDTCMQYHDSWDWLMPVAKKINGVLKQYIKDNRVGSKVFGVNVVVIEVTKVNQAVTTYEIGILYNTILNFIKWYNKEYKL